MNVLKRVKEAGRRADRHIRTILRKVSIFRRLNLSFMLLIISAAIFLTFFSFYKYSDEISKNIDKYISLLVQNAAMKIEDTMQEYEEEALRFYDNSQVVRALLEMRDQKPTRRAVNMNRTGIVSKMRFTIWVMDGNIS